MKWVQGKEFTVSHSLGDDRLLYFHVLLARHFYAENLVDQVLNSCYTNHYLGLRGNRVAFVH